MQKNIDKTLLSISISTSSTMIGFSIAIVTLILTSNQKINEFFDLQIVVGLYLFSILLNFSSIEFLGLSSWDDANYSRWNAIGASLYGSAKVIMVIGLSLTCLVLMKFLYLSIATLALFSIGELIYYYERFKHTKQKPNKVRTAARIAMALEVIFGFFLIFWVNLLYH